MRPHVRFEVRRLEIIFGAAVELALEDAPARVRFLFPRHLRLLLRLVLFHKMFLGQFSNLT